MRCETRSKVDQSARLAAGGKKKILLKISLHIEGGIFRIASSSGINLESCIWKWKMPLHHADHMWLVIRQRMTKCVFCVLCLFVFFFQVRKKQERVLYDIRHETILRKCMILFDYVVSPHRHPLCFLSILCFFSEKHKNTMTKCFFVFF